MDSIDIKGARTHNLKDIDLKIPRNKLVVFTGLSGSGKSSLAFDTLYAEGQRRYVESLSAYARQFLSMMEKPDVDHISGLSPAISIEQKSTSHNPRSTVGTITEIYDYLRLLFARIGTPKCPEHHTTLEAQTISQIVDLILALPEGSKIMLLAPIAQNRKGEYIKQLHDLSRQGFVRARINGVIEDLDSPPKLALHKKHTIEVVIDRIKVRSGIKTRLADSIETAVNLTNGLITVAVMDDKDNTADTVYSTKFACNICGYSLLELEPRLFSFNSPHGACNTCDGLGIKQFISADKVVHDSSLSLSEGAIRQFDRNHFYYYSMLQGLAKHFKFSLETPFKKLAKKTQQIILYGAGDTIIKFSYKHDNGRKTIREHKFEGVITSMERRLKETDSNWAREDLSRYLTQQTCPSCQGMRLSTAARHVYVQESTIADLTDLSIDAAIKFFNKLRLKGWRKTVAEKILKEIISRLEFLSNVGLNYLTLSRTAGTLSGGEAQRIRLASQIGAGLVGVMYVLDEPTIGLHQRDNARLIKTLLHLRDLGNTVIVVEHDEEVIHHADYIVDIGPKAGVHGGTIVAQGTLEKIIKSTKSLTGKYLSGKMGIEIPKQRTKYDKTKVLQITKASGNNLLEVSATFPIGLLTCVTGVSGSGKSTLINETLYPLSAITLNGATNYTPLAHQSVSGFEHLDKVVDINQSPIGRTPRSNPATYTGLFTDIRDLFSGTNDAKARGYKPGRFSFNVKGGRCEACKGDGLIKVAMHFLPDVFVKCDVCTGKRYNRETLEVKFKDKNINEVLSMTVEDAAKFFAKVPHINRKLQTLMDVGLSYITLGQSATTLSGGEAQRIKLAKELSRRDTGQTLYILDEPTTGLHFHDIHNLLQILLRLRDHGNTIIVIEHNLDVIKIADWIIDLGPEGGNGGGKIIATGTPEQVAKISKSHTGKYLKPYFKK